MYSTISKAVETRMSDVLFRLTGGVDDNSPSATGTEGTGVWAGGRRYMYNGGREIWASTWADILLAANEVLKEKEV